MIENFSGRKIAVLGFGLEGKDLCDYLLRQKARVTVFDEKKSFKNDEDYLKFQKKGIVFNLGPEVFKNGLNNFDIIFRSPGFHYLSPIIVEAQKKGAIISSVAKLFFNLCSGKIIGVTGTKGKGTTSTLIYKILKNAGKKVFLAGNVGLPMLSLLPRIDEDTWVILELSSFQLQDLDKSPYIAVVLFITQDHLDHHFSREEYIGSKANIVKYQNKDNFAVLNADDLVSSSFASLTKAQIFYYSRQKKINGVYVKDNDIYLFKDKLGLASELQILGQHNWDNVCAASTAAFLAGADLRAIKKTIFNFRGLEHRLEFVRNFKAVTFYNDSFSTTPETTIAAINSFKKPIILIAGGSEKGSDYKLLGQKIANSSVKTLILIGLTAEKIKKAVLVADFRNKIIFRPSGKMEEIVNLAFKEAKTGDVILLSPACASFGLFENYKQRGIQFKENVKAL
ncbi:MAG: UDP-N-acetylmuramoyl-L-alanine--D-glutamate ligase [Candidatus Shapirobacteria bacterium]|nr:UDP-N-acetylmuramoyl-L-alanine--D-glutamate ligase [Candidatus Shapirobacteria bacterium]